MKSVIILNITNIYKLMQANTSKYKKYMHLSEFTSGSTFQIKGTYTISNINKAPQRPKNIYICTR